MGIGVPNQLGDNSAELLKDPKFVAKLQALVQVFLAKIDESALNEALFNPLCSYGNFGATVEYAMFVCPSVADSVSKKIGAVSTEEAGESGLYFVIEDRPGNLRIRLVVKFDDGCSVECSIPNGGIVLNKDFQPHCDAHLSFWKIASVDDFSR